VEEVEVLGIVEEGEGAQVIAVIQVAQEAGPEAGRGAVREVEARRFHRRGGEVVEVDAGEGIDDDEEIIVLIFV